MTATLALALPSICGGCHVCFVHWRRRRRGERGRDRCSVGIAHTGHRRVLQLTKNEGYEVSQTLISKQRVGLEVKRNSPGDVGLRRGRFLQATTLEILAEGLTGSVKRRNSLGKTDCERHERIVITSLDGLRQPSEKGFYVARITSMIWGTDRMMMLCWGSRREI